MPHRCGIITAREPAPKQLTLEEGGVGGGGGGGGGEQATYTLARTMLQLSIIKS